MLYGIPYPGVYVTDEEGRVSAKFFHDSYKKRDSAERYLDAALGRTIISDDAPRAESTNEEIRIAAALHGGKGTLRQGVIRELVVRFELPEGLHIYGAPVPEGMIATEVTVKGPAGLVVLPAKLPPTSTLELPGFGTLNVWDGVVELSYPIYATGELASECRPLDVPSVDLEIDVRYQACTAVECLLPRTETLSLRVALDVIDIPDINIHRGHGQRAGAYDGTPAMRRLMARKLRANPLGLPVFLGKSMWLELKARLRRLRG